MANPCPEYFGTHPCMKPRGHAGPHGRQFSSDPPERTYTESDLKLERAAALREAANHQQHHIFSVHSGAVVQSSCSCGEQFPTQGSCEAWKQHILNLSDASALDKLLADARLEMRDRCAIETYKAYKAGNGAMQMAAATASNNIRALSIAAPRDSGKAASHSCNDELERRYPGHDQANDGDLWTCSCGQQYAHVCDEAEGCSWVKVKAASQPYRGCDKRVGNQFCILTRGHEGECRAAGWAASQPTTGDENGDPDVQIPPPNR
jgi:hypothetical protein